MQTECSSPQLVFEGLGKCQVVGKFDGVRMTSDGGALLLREADRLFDVTGRLAACFTDHRDPLRIERASPHVPCRATGDGPGVGGRGYQ